MPSYMCLSINDLVTGHLLHVLQLLLSKKMETRQKTRVKTSKIIQHFPPRYDNKFKAAFVEMLCVHCALSGL